jgi:tripartite ATP-independent transporter DctP family solute receptor
MMQRRTALKAIAGSAAAAALPGLAFAQNKISMKLGISLAQSHPTVVGLQAACAEIGKQTNGLLNIEVFPNSQLGSDTDMISQVRSGAIDMVATASGVYATLVPTVAVAGIPFAFADHATAFRAMDGDLGAHMRAAFNKANLVTLGKAWDHGFRHITTSTKPIISAQDLQGVKLRVPATPVLQQTFKALGASPTTIGIGEVYTALQTKVVDGQENPLAIIDAFRFHEVQKFCSLTGHAWECFWITANPRSWGAIPDNLRQIAARAFEEQSVKTRDVLASATASLQDSLTKRGLAFSTVNPQSFRDGLQKAGIYKEWKAKFGDETWALLEKYSGKLA